MKPIAAKILLELRDKALLESPLPMPRPPEILSIPSESPDEPKPEPALATPAEGLGTAEETDLTGVEEDGWAEGECWMNEEDGLGDDETFVTEDEVFTEEEVGWVVGVVG
jgi:hypothetical protein